MNPIIIKSLSLKNVSDTKLFLCALRALTSEEVWMYFEYCREHTKDSKLSSTLITKILADSSRNSNILVV